ncbi:MAG: allophycocyanin subunit beta, partial [Cyanobacteria bacterium J06648_11]
MQDAITSVINTYDVQGKYLDSSAIDRLKSFYATGELRVRAAATISANASTIVKDATAKALLYSVGVEQ